MKIPELCKRLASALLVPVALCAAAGLGWLDSVDWFVSDALYQSLSETATDGQIVVLGIDDYALNTLGPWPWPRDVLADVISALNAAPETRPAVIGIDVLFTGAGNDTAADTCLVDAARDAANVVTAASATFGSQLVVGDAGFYMDDRAVLGWETPFPALAAVTSTGHINAMADRDGVIRRGILWLDIPAACTDDATPRRVSSFARTVYERWTQSPNPPPDTSDGFFYIPFPVHPDGNGVCFEEFSVSELLEGTSPPTPSPGKSSSSDPSPPASSTATPLPPTAPPICTASKYRPT